MSTLKDEPQPRPVWTLLYPVASTRGISFILAATALLIVGRSFPAGLRRNPGLYILLLATVLIASYLYRVVEDTVIGRERPPRLKPDDWEDAWRDLLHTLGGCVIAFLPVFSLLLFALVKQANHLREEWFQLLLVACLFVGTLYYPMALLLNGFTQRFATAFNFGVGFRGIRTMGVDYFICCLFFLATHGSWILLEVYWVGTTPSGWNGARLVASAVSAFAGLYLSVMQMRALGLLYRKHQERLGWSIGKDA